MATYRLRVFGDDSTTVRETFTTDPADERPYLLAPESLATQEVDFAAGRATIGGCTVEVVDVPTTTQDTGYLTSLLATAGVAAAIGRRAHLEVWNGATWDNVVNGVIADVVLHESYSSYTLALKDAREVERRMSAFTRATTSSIVPPGVINGFGYNAESDAWLIPPTEPIEALYEETVGAPGTAGEGLTFGFLVFPRRDNRVPLWQVLTAKQEAALVSIRNPGTGYHTQYDRVRLLWREVGGGAYNVVEGMGYAGGIFPAGTYKAADGEVLDVHYLQRWSFAWPEPVTVTRPTDSTTIEVIFGYAGPASEDYPEAIEGTFGSVLKDIYDGVYSEPGAMPVVQYDETAVLALTEPFRALITEPLDDEDGVWKWIEENIYSVLGAAGALDNAGLISPVRSSLPDPDDVLLVLDDSNCEAAPGWTHGDSDVINAVSVEYTRVWRTDPLDENANGIGLASREIEVLLTGDDMAELALSTQVFGQKWLKLKSVGLTAIGGQIPYALGEGDVMDETGTQIAAARAREAVDRFLFGGQHIHVTVPRSVLGARRVGSWCIDARSWAPDYATGLRGANQLVQIVSINPLDSAWAEVHAIGAGPPTERLAQPLICGTPTVNPDGSITVPVCMRATNVWDDIIALTPTVLWQYGEAAGTSAADEMPGNRDGTYIGTPTMGQPGIIPNVEGTSVLFSGTTQYVQRAHDSGLNTGVKVPRYSPPTAELTTYTYPNSFCVLSFFEPTADPHVVLLAELLNQWSLETRDVGANSLLTGRSANAFTANNAVSGAILLNQLNMAVLQKTPTIYVPESHSGGVIELWLNGVKVYTAAAVFGGSDTAGNLQAGRGTEPGTPRYLQGTAYWPGSNLADADIEALWAKANTVGDFGDTASSVLLWYAIGDTEPVDAGAWRLAGARQDDGDLTIPPVPAGATAWFRLQGTGPNHQPSLYTDAVSAVAEETPRVRNVRVVVETDGSAVVTWTPNLFALGLTLHWDAHDPEVDPTFATVDVDASLGTYSFAAATVAPLQQLTVDVEPFDGWTGSAVSGTAGPIVRATGRPDVVYYTQQEIDSLFLPLAGGTLTGTLTATEYRVGSNKVVGARDTGWAAVTGTALKGGWDTSTGTATDVAQTVKAIYDLLVAHGLGGA